MKVQGQRKIHSLIETFASTAIGYVAALSTQIIVFPWFDIEVTFNQQLSIGVIFTIVSIIRGFFVRRLFNFMHVKGWL